MLLLAVTRCLMFDYNSVTQVWEKTKRRKGDNTTVQDHVFLP
uniref:Uncharacterized protein n=1 Tax=Anguilla anguilla TaxID=7936 RepID=A0A0E9T4I0_ANGAN